MYNRCFVNVCIIGKLLLNFVIHQGAKIYKLQEIGVSEENEGRGKECFMY